MEIYKRIAEIRNIRKLTQEDVVAKMKEKGFTLNASMLSRSESGIRKLTVEEFLALCDIYRIRDIRKVFTGKASMDDDLLKGLNYIGQQHVKKYIEFLLEDELFTNVELPRNYQRHLKLYDLPVSARSGEFLDGDSYELIDRDDTVSDEAKFAVRISGDSMTPRFVDGQIVFVRPQTVLQVGEVGIICYQGRGFIKQFGGDRLISFNPRYKPIYLRHSDEFNIYGKVVG